MAISTMPPSSSDHATRIGGLLMAQRRLAFGTPDSTVRKTTPRLMA